MCHLFTDSKFDCWYTLTDTYGSFSPSDIDKDGLYDKNMNCSWTIMAQPNRTAHLLIQNVDIETSEGCIFDSLQVSFIKRWFTSIFALIMKCLYLK